MTSTPRSARLVAGLASLVLMGGLVAAATADDGGRQVAVDVLLPAAAAPEVVVPTVPTVPTVSTTVTPRPTPSPTSTPAPEVSAAAAPRTPVVASPTATREPEETAAPRPRATPTREEQERESGPGSYGQAAYGPFPGVLRTFSFDADRTRWTATGQGLTVTLSMSDPSPRAGQSVHVVVTATGPASCCVLGASFGDSGSIGNEFDCDDPRGVKRVEGDYVWNQPGEWVVQASASGTACGGRPPLVGMRLPVRVSGAPTGITNGPRLPEVDADYGLDIEEGNHRLMRLAGRVIDRDGFTDTLVVDYGDGTAPVTYRNASESAPCDQLPNGVPNGNLVFLSRIPDGPVYSHRYAADGDYVVTVRAISRGCRGGDPQVGVGTFTYTAY